MQQSVPNLPAQSLPIPEVQRVAPDAPWLWLRQGWQDLARCAPTSLSIGALLVLLGYLLTWAAWQSPILVMTFISGFLLAGPYLGLIFYDLSRRLERGEPPTLRHALASLRDNPLSIALLIVMLGLILLAWIRFTSLLTALSVAAVDPSLPVILDKLLLTTEGMVFLGLFILSGAVLAGLVFSLSVVSFPLLLDRKVDTLTAVATSVQVVRKNPLTMLLWAAVIAGLTLIGLLTLYIGLIITMPLIGHATWHAYRQLVAR